MSFFCLCSIDTDEVLLLSEPGSPCTRNRLRQCAASAEKARQHSQRSGIKLQYTGKDTASNDIQQRGAAVAAKRTTEVQRSQLPAPKSSSILSKDICRLEPSVTIERLDPELTASCSGRSLNNRDSCQPMLGLNSRRKTPEKAARNTQLAADKKIHTSLPNPEYTQRRSPRRNVLAAQNVLEKETKLARKKVAVRSQQEGTTYRGGIEPSADVENAQLTRTSPRKSKPVEKNTTEQTTRSSPKKKLAVDSKLDTRMDTQNSSSVDVGLERAKRLDVVSSGSAPSVNSTVIDFVGARPKLDNVMLYQPDPPPSVQAPEVPTIFPCQAASLDVSPQELNVNISTCLQSIGKLIVSHGKETTSNSCKRRRHLKFDEDNVESEDDGGQPRKKMRVISQHSISKLCSSGSDKSFDGFPSKHPEPATDDIISYDEVSEHDGLSDDSVRELPLLGNVAKCDGDEDDSVKILEGQQRKPVLQQPLFGLSEPSSEWDKQLDSYLEGHIQRKAKEGSINLSLTASEITFSKPPGSAKKCKLPLPNINSTPSARGVLDKAFASLLAGDDQGESLWETSSPRAQRYCRRAAVSADASPAQNVGKKNKTTGEECATCPPKHSTPVRQLRSPRSTKLSPNKAFKSPKRRRSIKDNDSKSKDKKLLKDKVCLDNAPEEDSNWSVNSEAEGSERIDEDIVFNFSSPSKNHLDFCTNLPSPILSVNRRMLRGKRTRSLPACKVAHKPDIDGGKALHKSTKCSPKTKRLLKSASTTEKSFSFDFMRGSKSEGKRKNKKTGKIEPTEKGQTAEEVAELSLSPLSMSVVRAAALGLRSSPRKARVLLQGGMSSHQSSPSCSRTEQSLSQSLTSVSEVERKAKVTPRPRISLKRHSVQFANNLVKSYKAKKQISKTLSDVKHSVSTPPKVGRRQSMPRNCARKTHPRRKRSPLKRDAKNSVCYDFTSGSEL